MKHGEYDDEFPLAVFLGPDPELALVHADMDAWEEAHPCDPVLCEAYCTCHEREEENG